LGGAFALPDVFVVYCSCDVHANPRHETLDEGVLSVLQATPPPSTEAILTTLLNEITNVLDNFILVLDDYYVIDAQPIDHTLAFLIEHLPPQMHLVIATRENPPLPLARLRTCDQSIPTLSLDAGKEKDQPPGETTRYR